MRTCWCLEGLSFPCRHRMTAWECYKELHDGPLCNSAQCPMSSSHDGMGVCVSTLCSPKRVRESCPGSCGVPLSVRASSAYVSRFFFLFFIFSNYSYSPACAGRSRPTLEPLFRFALVAVRSAGIKAPSLIAERSRGVLIADLITLKSR